MLSSRYAVPVCILLTCALIPTVIHSYFDSQFHDGKSVNNIATQLQQFTSSPTKRYTLWGEDIFDSNDWFERNYQSTDYAQVRLFTARAYDHKRLYHHPELAVSYGQPLHSKGMVSLSGSTTPTVHLLSNDNGSTLVAYVLLYDGKFITDPISHQFKDSLRLLVGQRKAMTLIYASQTNLPPNSLFADSDLATILLLAVENFQTQAPPFIPQ